MTCGAFPPSTHPEFRPCRRPFGHPQGYINGRSEDHESDNIVPMVWRDFETLSYALLSPAFWEGFAEACGGLIG